MDYRQEGKASNLTDDGKSPLFYVLVPVYKVEKYIDECIQSVLNQTYPNWRMILVDDGSPDRCGDICDEYAKKDGRIKVIHKEIGGLISARRAAIDCVLENKGDGYLLFLDSDDLFEKDAFSLLNVTIEKTQSDLVVFNYRKFEEGICLPPIDNSRVKASIIEDKRLLYKKVFSDEGYNSLCRKAVSLSIVKKIDYTAFYHISHAEDLLQSIAFYGNAKKACFYEAFLYRYRANPSSITHTTTYASYKPDFTVRKMVWGFLRKEGVWTEDDFAQYAVSCKARLKNTLRMISCFKASKADKRKLFDEMLSDDYCQTVLSYAKPKDKMIKAFAKKSYWEVFLICDYYKVGSSIKRLLYRRK